MNMERPKPLGYSSKLLNTNWLASVLRSDRDSAMMPQNSALVDALTNALVSCRSDPPK